MAVSNPEVSPQDTFRVRGRVFVASSRRGVPELLVSVFHAQDKGATNTSLTARIESALRIGTVTTTADGSFALDSTLSDVLGVGTTVPRIDLFVVVSAPEGDGVADLAAVLYASSTRQRAGRDEHFNIALGTDVLRKFGLDGETELRVDEKLARFHRDRQDVAEFHDGVMAVQRAAVAQDLARKLEVRAEILQTVSSRPQAVAVTGELVAAGEPFADKVTAVADRAVVRANDGVASASGVPVQIYLEPADRTRLQPWLDAAVDGVARIPAHVMGDIPRRSRSADNPGTLLVNRNPIARACATETFEDVCAREHAGLPTHDHETPDPDVPPGTAVPLTLEDVPLLVARILARSGDVDGSSRPTRADRDAVEAAVEGFSLRRGPAEVPAFYDFHGLQIAFDHVWTLLVDEGLVEAAHAFDRSFFLQSGTTVAAGVRAGWAGVLANPQVYGAIATTVPADVAAQFDITLPEWTDLGAAHQEKLRTLARDITAACEAQRVSTSVGGIEMLFRRPAPADCERRRQELREQGERLIDAVRHDDYFSMHRTLRELHDRANANYEFTVFAADRNSSSVNFGLLNTYRQRWTPINYQAGRLVKTITLAPKEERKYSVKTTRSLKVNEKEALKNNRSLTSESTSTSRVEAEIVRKAQNKTNFSLAAEGSYNIGISKGDSKTSFGVEATAESSGTRKDFHEAVLKAAQEFKDERALEVSSEVADTFESNESGSIVNTNDELDVTHLFYELQRRYRVTEQLYRTLPVVLVAQPMPAPHEITESWVIANDWILNRHLLDDSFRPALTYLANKSVGDDFGLRELRKNLRQQRNLVDTLRIELSIAGREAENRYSALETAIQRRIGEESAEATDGWFSDVGDFFGGGGQDPEAAKARELAAKDAHQYAVEKAEKTAAALRQEVGSLHTITREYNDTMRAHLDNETRVRRLLVHIRNNIFHYMQAVWSMEPPDQRFLRLHRVEVPVLEWAQVPDPDDPSRTVDDRSYAVELTAREDPFEMFREPGTTRHRGRLGGRIAPITRTRPLVEVADLDDMLGFKGNYMIFPMREHNAMTEFMAAPYVDAAFGAMDPDELANIDLDDYSRFVCCLHERSTPEEFAALRPLLERWLQRLLADPLRNGDEIVVPTGSLFIEALPGTHPILEDFKLRHRELDVQKVAAEVRRAELGNVRWAARLLAGEREDPEIDKRIRLDGAAGPVIDVDNP